MTTSKHKAQQILGQDSLEGCR